MAVDYNAVRKAIADLLKDKNHDDGSWGPIFVRLAWHAAGTYDKADRSGGSTGAGMRYSPEKDWDANKGLQLARDRLEPVKAKFPEISYGDLWTLAGVEAVEKLGGPKVPWRSGRVDHKKAPVKPLTDGRLPDASQGAKHVRDIFYRMGFDDKDIVALVGAHSLGRCHTDRSGYDGPWTIAPTRFTNLFFKDLLKRKWTKKDWSGPEQFEDESKKLMMTPADLSLIQDPKFKVWVEKYADDKDLFFKDFSTAFSKLLELGVKFSERSKL